MDSTNGKWRKYLYFQHIVKMQRPHPMTEPKKRMGMGNVLEKWGAPLRFPSLSLSQNLPVRLASLFFSKAF